MFEKKKKTLIIGAGRFGTSIANSLSLQKYDVTILDKQEEAFRKVSDTYSGFTLVGDATDIDVLSDICSGGVQLVVIATNNDNVNILIAYLLKNIVGLEDIFIRINDEEKQILVEELQVNVICPFSLSLLEFERMIKGDI